jgi:hypothetical protein
MPLGLFVLVLEGMYEDVVDIRTKYWGYSFLKKADRLESIQAFSSTSTSASTAKLSTKKPSFHPQKHLRNHSYDPFNNG